jgi:hypothetical protein
MESSFVGLRISERCTRYEIAPSITVVKRHVILEGMCSFLRFTSSNDMGVMTLRSCFLLMFKHFSKHLVAYFWMVIIHYCRKTL